MCVGCQLVIFQNACFKVVVVLVTSRKEDNSQLFPKASQTDTFEVTFQFTHHCELYVFLVNVAQIAQPSNPCGLL